MSLIRSQVEREPVQNSIGSSIASSRLLHAAMSGLLAAGAAGCDDSSDKSSGKSARAELDDEELDAVCEDRVEDAVEKATGEDAVASLCSDQVKAAEANISCSEEVKAAEDKCDPDAICADKVKAAMQASMTPATQCEEPDAAKLCADLVTAADDKCKPWTATTEEKTTKSEQKEYTFAELTKNCDQRGGYVQIHAACGGVGACSGFSFGDWGPDGATLTEHSCSGSNGCNGLSCVVLPKDQGRSGADVYKLEYNEPGPGACTNCHAESDENHDPDVTKFKVWVQAGSTRTTANWLERTPAEQERVIAFGVHGTLPNGLAYNNMAAYNKQLSRAEIARVVQHLRTLTPILEVMKTADMPPTMVAAGTPQPTMP
jgi:hypothetical protein